ncbi:hypothetical protein EDC04DRAFT_2206540 [Pisolithus marmoratus]|nr:hypothetical protein EDC04DRAFT_2206540 [Pisolithus marmoratus]
MWSAVRAVTRLSDPSSSSKPSSSGSSSSKVGDTRSRGEDPPPLNNDQKEILKVVQGELIHMLAERKIDTSVHSHGKTPDAGINGDGEKGGKGGEGRRGTKCNEHNVKNRNREVTFQRHIQRAEAEVWSCADNFYNTYATSSKVELEGRRDLFKPPLSTKAGESSAWCQYVGQRCQIWSSSVSPAAHSTPCTRPLRCACLSPYSWCTSSQKRLSNARLLVFTTVIVNMLIAVLITDRHRAL